jgi:hypothetical protein
MIDKLDLRIPKDLVRGETIEEAFSYDPTKPDLCCVRPAKHYDGVADLKKRGIDAILHFRCRHGDNHSKLEILNVGEKGYSEIVRIIQKLTPTDPDELQIMRLDLAGDVREVPVSWFKDHARFKFKRSDKEYGEMKYSLVGKGDVETIYAGSRPNFYRIYNKVKEHQFQFRKMQRMTSKDADTLDFEQEFGVKETDVLTRIERQCGARGIPRGFEAFGALGRLAEFNPFTAIEIIASDSRVLPRLEDCRGVEYYTVLGIRAERKRLGMQAFRKQMNRLTGRNAARTFEYYRPFLIDESGEPVTMRQIVDAYQESTRAQLAA